MERTYRIVDETGTGPITDERWWAVAAGTPAPSVCVVTWAELAEVNEAETMDEIARLAVGQRTVLGMCDPIERVS